MTCCPASSIALYVKLDAFERLDNLHPQEVEDALETIKLDDDLELTGHPDFDDLVWMYMPAF